MQRTIRIALALLLSVVAIQHFCGGAAQADIDWLIQQLRSDDFEERQAATRALELIGEPALKALRHAAKTAKDLETRRRAEALAGKIGAVVDAVAAIRKRGGTVVVDDQRPGKPVVRAELTGPDVRDAEMKHVSVLAALQHLTLRKTAITADGLHQLHGLTDLRSLGLSGCGEVWLILRPSPFDHVQERVPFLQHLAGMTRLEELDLSWTSTIDTDLADLKKLPRLRSLNLNHTQIRGAGMSHLGELPSLQTLRLAYTGTHDADLKHLEPLKALRDLDLENTWVTDAGLEALLRLPALTGLNLSHCRDVSDAGLERLKPLTRLKELRLDSTGIGNNGLKHLRGMTDLEVLTLWGTRVDDDGVEHLRGLTALRTLVFFSGISDRSLEQLKGHTRLQVLKGIGRATDAGLKHLGGMTDLRVLDLQGAPITDTGLLQLKPLSKLQELCLRDTAVSDAGVQHLQAFADLERLDLFGTKVTPAGIQQLRKALPRLEVTP
jgi:hypothetical protein